MLQRLLVCHGVLRAQQHQYQTEACITHLEACITRSELTCIALFCAPIVCSCQAVRVGLSPHRAVGGFGSGGCDELQQQGCCAVGRGATAAVAQAPCLHPARPRYARQRAAARACASCGWWAVTAGRRCAGGPSNYEPLLKVVVPRFKAGEALLWDAGEMSLPGGSQ